MLLEVLYWIDHVWSSKEGVCCACDYSERLEAPSIMFCLLLLFALGHGSSQSRFSSSR